MYGDRYDLFAAAYSAGLDAARNGLGCDQYSFSDPYAYKMGYGARSARFAGERDDSATDLRAVQSPRWDTIARLDY